VIAFLIGLLATAGAASGARPGLAKTLGWLPTGTVTVSGAPGDKAPVLIWLRSAPRAWGVGELPACWSGIQSAIVAGYQVWRDRDDSPPFLVQAETDRSRVEACLEQTLRAMHANPRLTRAGAVTRIESDLFEPTHIGWSRSWIIWHTERDRVDELLSALGKRSRPSPILKVLSRVEPSVLIWAASTLDHTGPVLGIPNRSMTAATTMPPSGPIMRLTFEFGSAAEVGRALAAVEAIRSNAALPEEIRALARDVRVTPESRFLHVEVKTDELLGDKTQAALRAFLETHKPAPPR
jgi:hypothetical protein